jgi:RNA polymerase sigma factor (sigma-70 family)
MTDATLRLSELFEENRSHLRAVAYRMLGSTTDAEDAVQEVWLRLSRSDTSGVENLRAWLTTVVARLCLDVLRSRKARREDPVATPPEPGEREDGTDAEHELVMADSVGLALLVVLETLAPHERLAFVLHDMFAVPFEEIATIVGRSPTAVRQLASRARRRVQGARPVPEAELARQRAVVDAYLAAARNGDFEALIAVLDPDVVVRGGWNIRGAAAVASQVIKGGARAARAALVDGAIGLVIAPEGTLYMVVELTIRDGKIVELDAITDPAEIAEIDLVVLDA